MPSDFDVIVVGGGPVGENAASRAAAGGLSVALIEAELVGGECSYWACIPSKTLLHPAEVMEEARHSPGVQSAVQGPIDVSEAFRQRSRMTHNYDDASQVDWVRKAHVELIRGRGRLDGPRKVVVKSAAGSERRLTAARAVVVATGSTPFFPDVPGLKESLPWTNRQGTGAKSVPRRLLVLGGGPVGVELSQVWKSLGSAEVTLITQRMLARQEPFVGELIAQALRNSGVEVRLNTRLKQVRRTDKEVFATLDSGQTLAADEILVATGRLPASNDLGLETIGLEPGHPIEVDDSLRATRVPDGWLYACGDVNGRNLLTHMGKYQARLAGDAVLGKKVSAWADHTATPQVIFTQPQVASAGLTHEKAVQKGLRVRVVRHALEDVAGLSVQGPYWRGVAQLVVDEDRRIIVGATFVGPGVGEMIHAATIAIAGEVPLERLWHAVPSFPTVGEVWLHLLQAYGV